MDKEFSVSVFPGSISGGCREHQHLLSCLIMICGTCSLAPAHTQRLQGRAGHTGAEMGSVSTGREETWGQRNSSWQGQLQPIESGRKGENW